MTVTPSVLFIGGHDPVGGAGLQADIETAAALHCRAFSLVTCLTTQDSRNVRAVHPQPAAPLLGQLELLLSDVEPTLIKVGLLGDADLAAALARQLSDLQIPLVLDPVLAAGGGAELAGEQLLQVIREAWLPATYLLTPNRSEARRLAGSEDTDEAVHRILEAGCANLLLTGADEAQGRQVRNSLFGGGERLDFDWPRLPHSYHGSGCTLASACACELAQGKPLGEAVRAAQQFTWQALTAAERPGHGQYLPTRRSLKDS